MKIGQLHKFRNALPPEHALHCNGPTGGCFPLTRDLPSSQTCPVEPPRSAEDCIANVGCGTTQLPSHKSEIWVWVLAHCIITGSDAFVVDVGKVVAASTDCSPCTRWDLFQTLDSPEHVAQINNVASMLWNSCNTSSHEEIFKMLLVGRDSSCVFGAMLLV